MRTRIAWTLAASMIGVASAAACGARTGLDVPITHRSTSSSTSGNGGMIGDGGSGVGGGGIGGQGASGGQGGSGGVIGFPDAGPHDAAPDVLPPNDAQPDVVIVNDCVEAGVTYIYVITAQNTLLHYTPPSTFVPIGTLDCPSSSSPFSMGVDRQGTAFVVFQDGNLFKVSGANAHCEATSFVPDQHGFKKFGMAFSTDMSGSGGGSSTGGGGGGGPGETLYVAESSYQHASMGLAKIDVSSFTLDFVAPLSPDLGDAVELTGTGDGRLFAFGLATPGPGSHLAEIDKTTGALLSDTMLSVGASNSSFAFAYWGGDFYLFTDNGMGGPTFVTQYDPHAGTTIEVASLGMNVVGVGVSTCAPQ